MAFFRWFIGMPIAAVVTAALFIFMAGLISQPLGELPESKPAPDLKMTREIEDSEINPNIKTRPDLVEKYPETVIEKTLPGDNPGPVITRPDPGKVDPGKNDGGLQIGSPVIRVAPPYPEGCRSKGVEGVVIVQFDVTPEGNVVNVQVISAPDRCFNRIVSTVSKWKYPPAQQGGRSTMRYGVMERFNFQLTE